MAKLSPVIVLVAFLTGCLSHRGLENDLLPKSEGAAVSAKPVIQVYRIFGKHQGYLADYDHVSGELRAVHKVMIVKTGRDFWPTLQEDSRMARETRYYAVSRTPIPSVTEQSEPGSFRADLFRGHPVHESAIGHNLLVRITGTRFMAPAGKTSGTHVIIGDAREIHAVPQKADEDLISFSTVDGIKAEEGLWASAVLSPLNSRPSTTAMGCETNFSGELLAKSSDDNADFWGVCERKAPAGL